MLLVFLTLSVLAECDLEWLLGKLLKLLDLGFQILNLSLLFLDFIFLFFQLCLGFLKLFSQVFSGILV